MSQKAADATDGPARRHPESQGICVVNESLFLYFEKENGGDGGSKKASERGDTVRDIEKVEPVLLQFMRFVEKGVKKMGSDEAPEKHPETVIEYQDAATTVPIGTLGCVPGSKEKADGYQHTPCIDRPSDSNIDLGLIWKALYDRECEVHCLA